jgi:hypothetical protein
MHAMAAEYSGQNDQVHQHSPERQLWRAVISRALQDALNDVATISSVPQREQICSDARRWFVANTHDFQAACNAAGYDPSAVRQRVLRLIGE